MWLFLFFATMVASGRELARGVWSREEPSAGPFERGAAVALFSLAIAVALSWALALPKLLTRGGLLLAGAFVLACTFAAWRRTSGPETPSSRGPRAGRLLDGDAAGRVAAIVALITLAAAGAFFLWRGAVVFQPSHDGASYHLTKAALLVRAHGFETVDAVDVRVASWPCDYELLLADVLLLDAGDAHASWLSVGFAAFFLLSVAAAAERWWGRGRHVVVAVLMAAAMPVVLLHADTHKNDVLMAALFLASITSGARWAANGERAALLTALTAVALALGTKGSALFLVAALGPLALWGLAHHWREGARPSAPEVLGWCARGVVLFLALGGAVYVHNLIDTGHALGLQPVKSGYGDWGNVFRFTYLALARPFSRSPDAVWVPWRHSYWHWAKYDLYFSEWGLPTSLLFVVLPFGILRYARRAPARNAERMAASLVALAALLLIAPIHVVPFGFFASFVRYTMFFPVFVSLWTLTPAVAEMNERGGAARVLAAGCILATVAVFARRVARETIYDEREPLDYAVAAARHPENRRVRRPMWGEDRACVVVDPLAGPDDTIAFEGSAMDSWPYYCFGEALRRNVVFLHPERGLPVTIPDEARWVAIDRIGEIAFGHPEFRDFGGWDKYLMNGKPSREDLAVFEQLSKDPRFRLVRRNERTNQAVFERVPAKAD